MRKVLSPIILALAFMPIACSPEKEAMPSAEVDADVISAFAEISDPGTKVKFDDSYNILWASGDQLTLVGTTATRFTLASGENTTNGQFSGSLEEAGQAPYYALFPPADSAKSSAAGVTFNIPQRKGAYKNNIVNGSVPMIGQLKDGAVSFHNLFGLLKFTFTSAKDVQIKKIALHDLAGNMLWGDCFVPIQADTLAYSNISLSGGDNTITMVWNTPVTFTTTAKSYYIPIPPGAFDRGFSMVLYEYDLSQPDSVGRTYTFLQKVSDFVPAKRSVFLNMNTVALTEMSEPREAIARGYYKQLYIDAGVKLSTYYKTSTFPFINDMGLASDYEYYAASDSNATTVAAQEQCFARTTVDGLGWSDQNGQLLYPDNEPRFRMIYVNGGSSTPHGQSLSKRSLDNVHTFYENGGGYVGTCAGSFLATTFYGSTRRYGNSDPEKDYSFGIWPGSLNSTSIPVTIKSVKVGGVNYAAWGTVCTGMKVVSANLGKYSFAEGDTLQDTWHHGGSFMSKSASNMALNPDILMTYQYADPTKAQSRPANYFYTEANLADDTFPQPFYAYNSSGKVTHSKALVDSVSTFAYKESATSGRAVICGSHPERRPAGSKQLPFMKMMVQYAMDGGGDPTVKANLTLDQTRTMDKSTEDDNPEFTKIGDKQYHHFVFTNTKELKNAQIVLSSEYDENSGIDLHLALRKDDFAWRSDAEYVNCAKGGNKTLNIKCLPAGTWYISVYCGTTVNAATTTLDTYPCYFKYSGHTEVLDGIAYKIAVKSSEELDITGTIGGFDGGAL